MYALVSSITTTLPQNAGSCGGNPIPQRQATKLSSVWNDGCEELLKPLFSEESLLY